VRVEIIACHTICHSTAMILPLEHAQALKAGLLKDLGATGTCGWLSGVLHCTAHGALTQVYARACTVHKKLR
jgi:hypothetical protein